MTKISADLAQFLGALYRTGKATMIVYDGAEYTWDVKGTNLGSNWKDAESATLVSAIATAWKNSTEGNWKAGSTYTADLIVDGVPMTYTAVVSK